MPVWKQVEINRFADCPFLVYKNNPDLRNAIEKCDHSAKVMCDLYKCEYGTTSSLCLFLKKLFVSFFLCFLLFCFVLFCFVFLFCFVLFCFVLFCFLFFSFLFFSFLFFSFLFFSFLFFSFLPPSWFFLIVCILGS